jgi:hypothetical protein
MSSRDALSQWEQTVSRHLPQLSRPQACVLALWSYGMVLAKSCGISSVVALLAPLVGQSESTLRQRLREWCYDAKDKKGKQRQELDVSSCAWPVVTLDRELVDPWRDALSAGPRCHQFRSALHGALYQRGLSRLCHCGGLEDRGGQREGSLGTVLESLVHVAARQCTRKVDSDRVSRPGSVRQMAL